MTRNLFWMIIRDERGTSAMEYGLICAMIVIAMFSALQGFANGSNVMWTGVKDKVSAATAASTSG